MKLIKKSIFQASLNQLFTAVSDVDAWRVRPMPRLLSAKKGMVKFSFEDSSRASFSFAVEGDTVSVVIEHDDLGSDTAREMMANYWNSLIAELHVRLDRNA